MNIGSSLGVVKAGFGLDTVVCWPQFWPSTVLVVVATGVLVSLYFQLQVAQNTERETLFLWEKVKKENKSLCLVIQRILPDLAQGHQGSTSMSLQEPQHYWTWSAL